VLGEGRRADELGCCLDGTSQLAVCLSCCITRETASIHLGTNIESINFGMQIKAMISGLPWLPDYRLGSPVSPLFLHMPNYPYTYRLHPVP
jgi:hypothetical protein